MNEGSTPSDEIADQDQPRASKPSRRRLGCGCLGAIAFLLLLGPLTAAGWPVWIFESIWGLLFGWIRYAKRVLPQIGVDWELLGCGLAALVLAVLVSHRFLRWFARQEGTSLPPPWPFRGTLALTALLLSLFGASIAMTGIVHQGIWAMRSEEDLVRSTFGQSYQLGNSRQAQSLFRDIDNFATEHGGRYPPAITLDTTDRHPDEFQRMRFWKEDIKLPGEPWLYLVGGRPADEVLSAEPVLVQPRPYEDGQVVVVWGSGAADRVPVDDLPPEVRELFPPSAE